jgi:hypothetical protein
MAFVRHTLCIVLLHNAVVVAADDSLPVVVVGEVDSDSSVLA